MFQTEDPARVEGIVCALVLVFFVVVSRPGTRKIPWMFFGERHRFLGRLLGSRGPWVGRIGYFKTIGEWLSIIGVLIQAIEIRVPETGMHRFEIRNGRS